MTIFQIQLEVCVHVCAMSSHAISCSFKDHTLRSAAPFPWEASKKFHVPKVKPKIKKFGAEKEKILSSVGTALSVRHFQKKNAQL